jgi:hypothetical protein
MGYHAFKDEDGQEYGSFEAFYAFKGDLIEENGEESAVGWYWWACFPGCLPDGDPEGPFPTEQDAIDDAQNE